MAARVGTSAKMLRTHPPSYASAAAVDALTFSGTYPVTRLNVADASLGAKMTVYGYSTLKPTDLKVQCTSALVVSTFLLMERTCYLLTVICAGVRVPCCRVDAGRGKYRGDRAKCIVHVQLADGCLDRLQPCLRELHQDTGCHFSHCMHEVLRELFKLRLLAVYSKHFILCAQQRCSAHVTPRRLLVWN